MTNLLSFVTKKYETAHEVRVDLEKSYDEVIVVHDSEGYHVVADTTKLKKSN